jgi:hypothetical protein
MYMLGPMKIVTDYTTSVGSLAYSNIDQANMHQFPNTVTKNVITHNHHHTVHVLKQQVQANVTLPTTMPYATAW